MGELALSLAGALDPVVFARERLRLEPDLWQEQMLRCTDEDLLVLCSRQVGKSTFAAVKALHRAVYWPRSLVLLVSRGLRQSGELYRKINELYRLIPEAPAQTVDNATSMELANGSRIVSLPGSPDTIRSFSGPALIIEDEAAFVSDPTNTAIRPMLAASRGQLVLMSTPFGKRGHFFKAWTSNSAYWRRISIMATECPRLTSEFLAKERAEMGDWMFRQEYMCEFVDNVDQFFAYADVQAALADEVAPLFAPDGGELVPPALADEVAPLFAPEDP